MKYTHWEVNKEWTKVRTEHGLLVADVNTTVTHQPHKANACLIAAAPELLEMLKSLCENELVIDALSLAGLVDVLDAAEQAIDKAEDR